MESLEETYKVAQKLLKDNTPNSLALMLAHSMAVRDEIQTKLDKLEKRNGWSPEWPTERGTYWMYGDRWKNNKKEIYFVRVWINSVNQPTYICEGNFLYRSEVGLVFWQKCPLPEITTEIN